MQLVLREKKQNKMFQCTINWHTINKICIQADTRAQIVTVFEKRGHFAQNANYGNFQPTTTT